LPTPARSPIGPVPRLAFPETNELPDGPPVLYVCTVKAIVDVGVTCVGFGVQVISSCGSTLHVTWICPLYPASPATVNDACPESPFGIVNDAGGVTGAIVKSCTVTVTEFDVPGAKYESPAYTAVLTSSHAGNVALGS